MLEHQETESLPRPSWYRWVLASLVAWLVAPLAAWFPWEVVFLAIHEGKLDAKFVWYLLTLVYAFGLPFYTLGVFLLVAISYDNFTTVASWPWWLWACLGAVAGAIITIPFFMAPSLLDYPNSSTVLSGITSGFITTLIYRAILLSGGR
jgi:hypothetical protein